MGDVGACWDNAVVERFFGSLKHDWILKIAQPTREHMKQDVTAYMKYYNQDRLHTANGDMSPINYEMSLKKVSGWRTRTSVYKIEVELCSRLILINFDVALRHRQAMTLLKIDKAYRVCLLRF